MTMAEEGATMYRVYCHGAKGSRWVPYSAEYEHREDAEAIKNRCEALHIHDESGNELTYKIRKIQKNDK